MILHHDILVKGDNPEICRNHVERFFSSYQLIRYDSLTIADDGILPASAPGFRSRLEQGIRKNRDILLSFLAELSREHVGTLQDLSDIKQGYASALLHTACHILDGFFGIDTFFYNLEEDSHWVTEQLSSRIKIKPADYYILAVTASLGTTGRGRDEEPPLGHRHTFREHITKAIFKT